MCKRCLSCYANQYVLVSHTQTREHQETSALKTKNRAHLYWGRHFQKNPMYSRINANFQADNKTANSSIGK